MVLVCIPCDHVTLINVAQWYAVKGSDTTMLTVEIELVNKTFCYPRNAALLKKRHLPTPA